MLIIQIILAFMLLISGLMSFYSIYDEIKEDYKTYKQICIYPWNIIMFIIGIGLIIDSYLMLSLIL